MGVKSRLGACSSFSRLFLIIVNIAFAVLGIGMIIVGAYVRLNKVLDTRIISMLKGAELGGLNLGDVIMALSAFIIVIGVFMLFVAANGGFGACLQKKCPLVTYVVVLLVILLIELAVFIVWCKFAYGTNTWLKAQFNNLLRFYNGWQGNTDVYSRGWNLMFMLLDCCGVSRVSTFQNDFQRLNTYWWSNLSRGPQVVPYTCCRDSNVNNYMMGNNPQCTVQMQFTRQRGCYEAFRQMFTDISTTAITINVIVIITQVAAVLAAIFLIIRIDREKKQSISPSKGNVYPKGMHDLPLPDSKPR